MENQNPSSPSLVIQHLKNEIKKGYAPIVLFVGRQRVGKTAMSMRFAWELDHSWTTDLMTYKVEDFVEIYDKYNKKIIILDEAGVTLDPYEHMSITQRVYSHVIQTQAYKQNVVFLVLPRAKNIGRQHRDYVDIIIHVRGRGCYTAKVVVSPHDDLSFRPPFQWIAEEKFGVPLPPAHIWKPYLESGQKQYKENILEMQKQMLTKKMKSATAVHQIADV